MLKRGGRSKFFVLSFNLKNVSYAINICIFSHNMYRLTIDEMYEIIIIQFEYMIIHSSGMTSLNQARLFTYLKQRLRNWYYNHLIKWILSAGCPLFRTIINASN